MLCNNLNYKWCWWCACHSMLEVAFAEVDNYVDQRNNVLSLVWLHAGLFRCCLLCPHKTQFLSATSVHVFAFKCLYTYKYHSLFVIPSYCILRSSFPLQALIVSEAYRHCIHADWVNTIYKKVVVKGDFK